MLKCRPVNVLRLGTMTAYTASTLVTLKSIAVFATGPCEIVGPHRRSLLVPRRVIASSRLDLHARYSLVL